MQQNQPVDGSAGSGIVRGMNTGPAAVGVVRNFLTGAGFLGQGLRMWISAPKLMLIGAVPALIVAVFYLAGIVVLLLNFDVVTAWATPFAENWDEPFRTATRVAATIALLGIAILLVVYTFTALTLAVGDTFYERIWRSVEKRLGGAPPDPDVSLWRSLARSVGEALRLLVVTALIGVTLFACGFIPVIGQTVVPVLGALVGGWFLTLELTGFAFSARGLSLRDRRRMLGARRARTLGFGVLTYLLFLLPLGAVVVMPAAVAGATLLSRDALAAAPHP
jgi:CysZ protein